VLPEEEDEERDERTVVLTRAEWMQIAAMGPDQCTEPIEL